MDTKLIKNILKKLYLVLFIAYAVSLTSAVTVYLLESFTYAGSFARNFNISGSVFIWLSMILGFLISIVPANYLDKNKRWLVFYKKVFSVSFRVLLYVLAVTIFLNIAEFLSYDNFVYSKIHLQPLLLYRVLILVAISVYIGLSLILRSGGENSKLQNIFLFKRKYILTALSFRNTLLLLYSVILIGFAVTNSVKFAYKFYQPDKTFLKENELEYFKGQLDISKWIATFFPLTKDLVMWCNAQTQPVEIVTLDPQMMWMNYEGMTRVFLTNCYYANIYSENKTYSYIGKNKMFLSTVSKCNSEKKDFKGNPSENKYLYLNDVNNYYICRSKEIVPGLYLYQAN